MDQTFATGLPLLSGDTSLNDRNPPSERSDSSCRRCDKEFNIIFSRSRTCNHCGYLYCSSCSDYQALAPRIDSESGLIRGYEPANVCAFCNDKLTITASSKSRLRSLPLAKLREYMDAYNIKIPNGAIEKEELINTIIQSREHDGCLPRQNERYYRTNSVPDRPANRQATPSRARNLWQRATGSSGSSTMPSRQSYNPPPGRPPPTNQGATYPTQSNVHPRQPTFTPRPPTTSNAPFSTTGTPSPRSTPGPPSAHTGPNNPPSRPQPPISPQRPNPSPRPPRTTPPHPRPNTAPPRTPPHQPPPTLDVLLSLAPEQLSKLSIHDLKGILSANHVNARLAVEKSDLIDRVKILVEQEREERETARIRREQEEREEQERARILDEERIRRQTEMLEEHRERDVRAKGQNAAGNGSPNTSHTPGHGEHSSTKGQPPPPPASYVAAERNGLCVICQDEDANIAIVDCGHLCLCRSCSQVIMNSTKECPMCRTRIVTEARLLRIFKT